MKKRFNVIQADWGIGDIICSLYALQGLAQAHPESEIHFYMQQHFQWATLVNIPGLQIHKYYEKMRPSNSIMLYDSRNDPNKFVKHTNSPKQYYAQQLGVFPSLPPVHDRILKSSSIFNTKYIVLSPFASQINRTWDIDNWKVLAEKLMGQGFKVIALGSPSQKERSKSIGVEYFGGQSAEWVAKVCYHAELIIGNDSGIAHLGGLLGKRTLVIMSQLLPGQFYDLTDNTFFVPQQQCTGCRFIPDYGYVNDCNFGCWVLQTANPNSVFGLAIKEILKAQI